MDSRCGRNNDGEGTHTPGEEEDNRFYASFAMLIPYTVGDQPMKCDAKPLSALHLHETEVASSSAVAAAALNNLVGGKPECDHPLWDGFAGYLRGLHQRHFGSLARPKWIVTREIGNDKKLEKFRNKLAWVENEIRMAADKIGISIVLEVASDPSRLADCCIVKQRKERGMSSPAPETRWEGREWSLEMSAGGRINTGTKLHGRVLD